MTDMQWALEGVLVLLLSVTLFHAVRLERALGTLRRDRATLEELVAGFNESTRQAEDGAERLRLAAELAGKQIARQVERANGLKEDLLFLCDRGERSADLIERKVTAARQISANRTAAGTPPAELTRVDLPEQSGPGRSRAERDLLRALGVGR